MVILSGMGKKREKVILCLILLAALALRIVLRLVCEAYPETIYEWAELLYRDGFSTFYSHHEVQWPYPPLYLYILWLMQCLIEAFHVNAENLRILIVQLPPILCDIAGAYLVWRTARVHVRERAALVLCALYAFNPAVIHNSSVWGQTDAVFTLTITLMCLALCEKKLMQAFIYFGASLMLKQQSLSFAPVLMIGIVRQVFLENFSWKRTLKLFAYGLCVIAAMLAISLPFGVAEMLRQYLSVQSGMAYASVDAYNFWTLIGRNWADVNSTVLGIPCRVWGVLAIIAITLSALIQALILPRRADAVAQPNKKRDIDYPLIAAYIISLVFCFGSNMHERYLFSAMLLLLLAYALKPSKMLMVFYLCLSLLQLANTVAVFEYNLHGLSIPKAYLLPALSALLVLTVLAFAFYFLCCAYPRRAERS